MDIEALRLAVYGTFARGKVPTIASLAEDLGTMKDDVRGGLFSLANNRHVVLGADGEIAMAHPFSAVPMGFSVMAREELWWGGCAWDSFALPHLLPGRGPMLVATRCPACERPHSWNVSNLAPPDGDQVAHFLVPVERMWVNVLHTCSHQRIFCSEACVDDWLALTGRPKGAVLDLTTLWNLAQHWYDGRLERGYRRREPAESAQYLRSVGLTGAFWGA
ncbi:hypothetical protein ABIE44_000935 [Marmoricola sp. OAE513]|uniref:organomercurial lyase n=1 Tax=Marmoricola sp. OAE513 TaxID=2817894 RepID=UPI001AE4F783